MKIVPIQDTNIHLFRGMLPGSMLLEKTILLGCIDGNTALGTAAFERYQMSGSISWLYVAPEHRGKGACRMLLQAIMEEAEDITVDICYDRAETWAAELDLMLMRRGFIVTVQKLPRYTISPEVLQASPALKTNVPLMDRHDLVPFTELTSHQLKTVIVQCEDSGQFYVSRADFADCSPSLSMISLDENDVNGMMLVKDLGSGRLELSLMYLASNHQALGLSLIRHTVKNILENVPDLQEISFTCVAEVAEKIAEKLVPDAHKIWVPVTRGILLSSARKIFQ